MKNSPKNKKSKHVATNRDMQIFKFLWKWKAVSTRAIAKKFFPDAIPYSAYIRLTRLHKIGYVEPIQVEEKGQEIWSLSKKGYLKIKPRMVELAVDGFKSENYYHDFLATAFHLGEWLTCQPKGAQTFSEQQLRRIPEELWPAWIPKSNTHRPDGYSHFSISNVNTNQSYTVAFEAELSAKGIARFERTIAFYDSHAEINFVFWLVDSIGIYNLIARAFEKYHGREWSKHHFILLDDFRQKGWTSAFISGQYKGKSISQILGYNSATKPLHNCYESSISELLNNQKRPVNSKASLKPEKTKIY